MRLKFKKYGVLATVAALAVPALVQAAPPGIDPAATVQNKYGATAGLDDVYMNKNQLALRITGKDFDAHIDNNEAHWQGSGMELIENLVNDLILNAEYTEVLPGTDKMFRNWVDLLLKRFLVDGNPLTPIDYDTQTFFMVDGDHAAQRLPSQPVTATLNDINGDGIEGGFEPSPLLDGTCLNLPGFGDMCMTMYLGINIVDTISITIPEGTYDVNDTALPGIDFDRYDSLDPDNTSHILVASQPKLTFDNELDSCDSPEFPASAVGCDDNEYRDDDDSLYLEIQLTNFRADVLFEPPFTTDVTATTTGEEGCINAQVYAGSGSTYCGTAAYAATVEDWWGTTPAGQTAGTMADDYALNITDMVDGDVFNEDIGGNDYDDGIDVWPVPGCPMLRGGDDYAPECDLSNYLKLNGSLEVFVLKIGASISIVSAFNDVLPDVPTGPSATTDTINLGVVIKELSLDTDLIFEINAGPYCDGSATVGGADLRAIGHDAMGVYPYQTDNPNNCTNPADSDGIVNRSDDSAYLKSEKFAEVLSYIRAEVQVAMDDFFAAATNPSYFLGPTGMGIDATLISEMDWPLADGVDYLFILASLDSSVDSDDMTNGMEAYKTLDSATWVGDTIEEFWADRHGIMMPFNMGVGFDWYSDITTPTQKDSCVIDEAAFTGYVDGYGQGDNADDPVVSHPLPSLKTEWTGFADPSIFVENTDEDMASSLLQRKIPDVNGAEPFATPTTTLPTFNPPLVDDGAYAIGLGIHQNLLSKVLYEMVIKGLLCMDFGVTNKADALFDTGLFQFFVPYLYDNYEGMPVGLRVVPYVANPNNVYWNDSALATDDTYPSRISEAQANNACVGLYPCPTTVENPVPRIMMGGINTFDTLKQRYAGEISTANIGPVWPDFSVVIPHMVLEFYVWDESGPSDVLRRAFALDVGLNVGLNIDITQDPGSANADTFGTSTFMDEVTNTYAGMARPAYSGTNFPIGCHTATDPDGANATAYPCEIEGVPSRLVVFLGGILDPELNAVLVYDEMSDAMSTDDSFLVAGVTDPTLGVFEDAISNLIGLALSSEISLFTEIGFDPAAWLDIPIVLNFPYIGPSYVLRDSVVANDLAKASLGCDDSALGSAVVGDCADPIGLDAVTSRDVSDNDTNGFGDYLVAAFSVDVTWIESDYLFRLIDSFIEPAAYPCDATDIVIDVVCQSEYYQLGSFLTDILGAPAAPSDDIRLPQGYVSPETYIKGIRKANAVETIIDFEGYHPTDGADSLTYAWRVDGGFWTSFIGWNSVRIPGLFEGKHVFEVKAKDRHGNVEWTPSRIEFVVDSIAPKTQVMGDRVQGVDARFYVEVDDSQTLPEDVRVSYNIDGSDWTRYSYNKDVAMTVEPGRHTLNVRTVDEAGNVATTALNFSVEEGGFGCSVAGSGSTTDASMLFLLVPAIVIAIRRRRS